MCMFVFCISLDPHTSVADPYNFDTNPDHLNWGKKLKLFSVFNGKKKKFKQQKNSIKNNKKSVCNYYGKTRKKNDKKDLGNGFISDRTGKEIQSVLTFLQKNL